MEDINELVEKLKLKDYFSQESLDKLTSTDSAEKAKKLTDLKSLQEFFDEMNLPELSGLVLFDPDPIIAENEWGTAPTGSDLLQKPFGQELDKEGLVSLAKKVEKRQSALKLLDKKSPDIPASEAGTIGAVAGAAVGVAATVGTGIVVGGFAGPFIALGTVVGAAAGAVGALLSNALGDDD
jgi:hypothetical protein